MVSIEFFRHEALSLPSAVEDAHGDARSFKISKKIFATLSSAHQRATVKLSLADQDIFCLTDTNMVYPVPNKWGKQGWTHINLQTVKPEMCTEILKVAYCEVAPQKYAALINFDE